jgi:hypothetical protein
MRNEDDEEENDGATPLFLEPDLLAKEYDGDGEAAAMLPPPNAAAGRWSCRRRRKPQPPTVPDEKAAATTPAPGTPAGEAITATASRRAAAEPTIVVAYHRVACR